MSVYIPPQKKKRRIWPLVLSGGTVFILGTVAVMAFTPLADWVPNLSGEETDAAPTAAVARAAGVETLVLPPANAALDDAQAPDVTAAPLPGPAIDIASITALASGAIETAAEVAPIETRAEIVEDSVWQNQVAGAIQAAHHTKVQEISDAVVAGLYTVTAEAMPGSRPRFELTNVADPQAGDEIEALLTEAVASGDIDVPAAIQTSDGGFDAQALLYDLVQTNLQAGGEEEIAAAEELRQQTIEAVGAETETVAGEEFYIVQAGDNLGYISLLVFGTVADYPKIYEANRDILSDPNRIQIGQRLRIPSA